MKPRIGISMNYQTNEDETEWAYLERHYFEVIAELGAVPLPIVPVDNIILLDTILRQVNGVLFTGGRDLDPALYDEDMEENTDLIHPRRQRFELMLYEQTIKRRLPVLGICLGIQMINVAHGGSLYQHLPDLDSQVDHGSYDEEVACTHPIKLNSKSNLYNRLRVEQITVPSCHHQGINRLGKGLLPAAVAEDGLVEAIEYPGYSFLAAVQWHAERDIAQLENRLLFDKFLDAARQNEPEITGAQIS